MAIRENVTMSLRSSTRARLVALFPAAVAALLLAGCFSSETVECAGGVICPSGSVCTADGLSCTNNQCGNGQTDEGETCDDGNQIDTDECRVDCTLNVCGDGVRDTQDTVAVEECDTGGDTAACDADCTLVKCGDNRRNVAAGEACDDQPTGAMPEGGDGCSADCKSTETCGNGVIDTDLPNNAIDNPLLCAGDATTIRRNCVEACDTMNPDGTPNPLCSPNCLSRRICGDGIRDTSIGEVCDDGNTMSGDVCSSDCLLIGAGCGNGVTDGDVGEECDTGLGVDGNDNPIDSATCIDCKVSYCGDARVNPVDNEACDPGTPGANVIGCNADCTEPVCGDGITNLAAGELCDDDNAVGGDGCSATCQLEANTLTVTKVGTGIGTVTSAVAGINCGMDCAESYQPGAMVTLDVVLGTNSVFTGWAGACTGTAACTLTMNMAKNAIATFDLNTLTVTKGGTGTGAVTGTGIACGADCTEAYPNTTMVTLMAAPVANSTFDGWSGGGCTGTGNCITTMANARTINAQFTLRTLALTVAKTGTGTGTVSSNPPGIACGATCVASFDQDSVVHLLANPTSNNTFTGWSGAGCSGTGGCDVTMDVAKTVTANFALNVHQLTVLKIGNGTGTVTSGDGGIGCGTDCTEGYNAGTVVVLTATPSANNAFGGWSGGGCSGTGTCMTMVTAATTVTATFTLNSLALTVTNAGTGSGTVTSVPTGVTCPGTCSASFLANTAVTLSAAPALGSLFAGWSGGGCAGTGACVVTMDAVKAVTATFTLDTRVLTINKVGNGSVLSAPAGINCGATCSASFNFGAMVVLTATPDPGTTTTWSQAGCTGNTCTVTMDASKVVTATFSTGSFVLTAAVVGSGTVNSVPFGIGCPVDCTESFPFGTVVGLVATPAAGFAFSAWSGGGCSGTGLCSVTVNAATTVTATFVAVQYPLMIVKTGLGTGAVTGGTINCGATCSATLAATSTIVLTAAATPSSTFTGWSNVPGCPGTGTCTVTMSQAQTVVANFDLQTRALTITKAGTGMTVGTVTSTPAGIACGATCTANFTFGTLVVLTATPGAGNTFTGWSGADVPASCTSSTTCLATMDQVRAITATFTLVTFAVTVTKAGAGAGTVVSSPVGINCGATCSFSFVSGASVALTATATAGSTFTGWSGPDLGTCMPMAATCTVVASAVRNLTATFAVQSFALTVTNAGAGTGTVMASVGAIDCPGTCSDSYLYDTDVTLTAAADPGSTFMGWSGVPGCTVAATCLVDMTQTRAVTATFVTP